jgi:hypothetical protein
MFFLHDAVVLFRQPVVPGRPRCLPGWAKRSIRQPNHSLPHHPSLNPQSWRAVRASGHHWCHKRPNPWREQRLGGVEMQAETGGSHWPTRHTLAPLHRPSPHGLHRSCLHLRVIPGVAGGPEARARCSVSDRLLPLAASVQPETWLHRLKRAAKTSLRAASTVP